MATRIPSSAAFERSPSPVTPSGSTLRGSGTMSTAAYSTRKKTDRATPDHHTTRSHRRAKGIAKTWTAPETAKNHMNGTAPTCSRIANQWKSPSAYRKLSPATRAKPRPDVRDPGTMSPRPTTRISRSSAATAIASDEWTIGAACVAPWSCAGAADGGACRMSKAGTLTAKMRATRISAQPVPTLHPRGISGAADVSGGSEGAAAIDGTTHPGFGDIFVVHIRNEEGHLR